MQTGTEPQAWRAGRVRVTAVCTKNRYYRRSRLGERKFREVVRCLALDLSASDTARLTGISIRSSNTIFLKIRQRMAQETERHSIFNIMPDNANCVLPAMTGTQALPRSSGKPPLLFGIHRSNDSVHTELVPDCSSPLLHNIVSGDQELASVFQPKDWVSRYHGMVDVRLAQYYPVQWHGSQYLRSAREMNGSEPFWVFTRRRLQRFMGIPRHTYYLHLKETEYRYNRPRDKLYLELLALLRKYPL